MDLMKADVQLSNGNLQEVENCSDRVEKTVQMPDTNTGIDDEVEFQDNWFSRRVQSIEHAVQSLYAKHSSGIKIGVGSILLAAYLTYFGICMNHRIGDEGSIILIVITAFLMLKIFFGILRRRDIRVGLPVSFYKLMKSERGKRHRKAVSYFSYFAAAIAILTYLAIEIFPRNVSNLQSFFGMLALIFVCFVFSSHPSRVNWHPVFWSLTIQFVVAFLTLRTKLGYDVFKWLGDFFNTLFNFSDAGSKFVIGKEFADWGLALSSSGVIIFTNAFIFLLTHLGVIELIVLKLGGFLAFCLQTGPVESVVAAANIFIGLAEAPLLVRPYLPTVTKSEIHAIMTCGFASISGGIMGLFIRVGAPANHLLTAAVISAPASLAISKLMYPETERVRLENQTNIRMADTEESNSLSAYSEGAVVAVRVITAMWSNMLAFVSFLALLDGLADWCGQRAGVEGLTFGIMSSYALFPLSLSMGVELSECLKFGELMGIKMFATPFIAYKDLGDFIKNREALEAYESSPNGTGWHYEGDDIYLEGTNTTLIGGVLTERSEVIATYAMCGLSAFPAIGMTLGALVPLCPARKMEIVEMIVRAFIAGNVANCITGNVAGILFTTEDLA